jgi:hypothetical protein
VNTPGIAGAVWGVGGIVAFVVHALRRMTGYGFAAYEYPFEWTHWVLLWTWVPAMIWAEGYRGFHLSFSPMVAARAKYLAEHPRPLHVLLAPVFCLGLIHATRSRFIRSASLTAGIIAVVLLVRRFPQPWRGIIDLGVIMGLSIGVISMIIWAHRAFTDETFDRSPDVPTG